MPSTTDGARDAGQELDPTPVLADHLATFDRRGAHEHEGAQDGVRHEPGGHVHERPGGCGPPLQELRNELADERAIRGRLGLGRRAALRDDRFCRRAYLRDHGAVVRAGRRLPGVDHLVPGRLPKVWQREPHPRVVKRARPGGRPRPRR